MSTTSAEALAPPHGPSRLATLHPAWGAALMTLSGGALVSVRDPLPGTELDAIVGAILLGLASLAALALTTLGLARVIAHRAAFAADLANPGLGAMIASWPAGLQILAIALLQAGISGLLPEGVALVAGLVAFIPGVLGTLLAGYAFYTRVIGLTEVPHAAVTGNWFVPVVPLVLVPSVAVRALELGVGGDPAIWAFAGLIGWGIGFVLFLLLASIIGSRLLVAAPPTAHQAPSWWSWLAPLGAGGLGLLAVARLGEIAGLPPLGGVPDYLVTVLWGFSIWWALLAIRLIVRERRTLHFHPGWWGFGFPTAALTSLTGEVARIWDFGWLSAAVPVLWIALLLVAVGLSALTVRAIANGTAGVR